MAPAASGGPPARSHPGARLRELLAAAEPLVSPAVWDCMTAAICERAGSAALFVSGAGLAGARLGLPDFGFLGLTDLADAVTAIARSVGTPLLVDADTGFGNLANAVHAAMVLERSGAAAMTIEDQVFPKRCGHLAGATVVPVGDHVAKLEALVAERPSRDFLFVARTDAVAAEGIDGAIERARRYREAGADVIFVEAPRSRAQVERIASEVEGPKLYNLATGGVGPQLTVADLGGLGFDWVMVPGNTLAAVIEGVTASVSDLLRTGSDRTTAATAFSPATLAELFGAQRWRGLEDRYTG
jgi:2-methylisocitrate lyase-like PEP mutase family enzyme